MRFISLALVSFLLLTGFGGCSPAAMFVKQDPADCYQNEEQRLQCETHCSPQQAVDSDDINAFHAIATLNAKIGVDCNLRHEACMQCIDRLRQARIAK